MNSCEKFKICPIEEEFLIINAGPESTSTIEITKKMTLFPVMSTAFLTFALP